MSTTSSSAPAKRACDSCHRRKVKCIGEGTSPCKNCVSAGLACTYNAIPQKKGPKGSRAKVLSELRENQRNSQLAGGFPPELGLDGRMLSAAFARTPGLVVPGLVENCIEFFFSNVYPVQPVLHRQRVQETLMNIDNSTEAYSMLVALCANVMIQSNMLVPPNLLPRPEMASMSNVSFGHALLEESVRVRRGFDYLENPTHLSVLTSWLIYGCYFGLGRDNTAWSYLRQATTLAQILGMHDEETYKNDPLDISKRRILYWLLFVTERTHALHKHRPITLYPTIHLPTMDEIASDRPVAAGLNILINLYKPFDDTFFGLWNKVRAQADPGWISQLQDQISEGIPSYLDCTEIQAVDIRITHQWLRTMAWQLCVSQGLVSSVSTDSAMTFKYPIEISRDLLSMTHQFSQQAMEVHGVGLIEKLFDIACCLTDVVACIPFPPETSSHGPRDYVSRFLSLFSALRGGQTRYLPLLVAKVSEVLPDLPLPRSLNVPQNMPPSTIGMSPAGLGTVPSNINDDLSRLPVSSPSYLSTDLIRQLAAQTGAQLPFGASQHSLLSAPSSRVEDLSLYDSSATHSTHSGSASQSTTPGPFESSPQSRPQTHTSQSHTHQHIQGHLSAYDPRFSVQGFPVDPSMSYKQEEVEPAGHLQGQSAHMYAQNNSPEGALGHGVHHGGRYVA